MKILNSYLLVELRNALLCRNGNSLEIKRELFELGVDAELIEEFAFIVKNKKNDIKIFRQIAKIINE